MDSGERLSAYVAGELDLGERAELESELARDPALREQLARVRAADSALRQLGDVTPPPGFSQRLHARLDRELAAQPRDELAARRARSAWRPLVTAAAAAGVLAVVGFGGGLLLRGGAGGDSAQIAAGGDGGGSGVEPVETDNDYNETELQRLAVGVDLGVPPDLESESAVAAANAAAPEAAADGADDTEGNGTGGSGDGDALSDEGDTGDSTGVPREEETAATVAEAPGPTAARRDPVAECLPALTAQAPAPVILVYVELAKYEGEPAIIYVFAARDPATDQYRRAEVWAVSPDDCQVLAFAQYDQPPVPGS